MFVEQLTLVAYEDRYQDTTLSVRACSTSNCILAVGGRLHSKRLHQVLQSEKLRKTCHPTITHASHNISVTRSSCTTSLKYSMWLL